MRQVHRTGTQGCPGQPGSRNNTCARRGDRGLTKAQRQKAPPRKGNWMNMDANMPPGATDQPGHQVSQTRPRQGAVIESADLFADRKELEILHRGERYRLRVTKNGKLILNK